MAKGLPNHKAAFSGEDLQHLKMALQLLETASIQFVLFRGLFVDNGDTAKASPKDTRRAAVFILDLLERASGELFSIDSDDNGPWKFASAQLSKLWDTFGIVATVCAALEGGTFPDGRAVLGCPVSYAMNPARKIVDAVINALRREMASIPVSTGKRARPNRQQDIAHV